MSRPRRAQRIAPLPSTDLDMLRQRVRAVAENRPAIYRMTDALGRVLYVGKAKRLRTRLLSYFRASYPDDKAARILYAASEIRWDYVPSEFAAFLGELRQIRKLRPYFNHKGNRTRRAALIKIAGGPAPRIYGGGSIAREDVRCYGPFQSMARMAEAVRTLTISWGSAIVPAPRRWSLRARAISSSSRGRRPACGTSWASAPDPVPVWLRNGSTVGGWIPRWHSWRAAPSSQSIG